MTYYTIKGAPITGRPQPIKIIMCYTSAMRFLLQR